MPRFVYLVRELQRPARRDRAGLDDDLVRSEVGGNLIEHRLHGGRIRDDHENRLGFFYGVLDRWVKVRKISRRPIPAAHGMAVCDQVPRPSAADDSQSKTAKFMPMSFRLAGA